MADARNELVAAEAEAVRANATINSARAEADRIRAEIRDAVLVSPIRARVETRPAEPGEVPASGGRVFCLDPDGGRIQWTFDVAEHAGTRPLLYSSPAGLIDTGEDGPVRRLYIGAELRTESSGAAVLYCLDP